MLFESPTYNCRMVCITTSIEYCRNAPDELEQEHKREHEQPEHSDPPDDVDTICEDQANDDEKIVTNEHSDYDKKPLVEHHEDQHPQQDVSHHVESEPNQDCKWRIWYG